MSTNGQLVFTDVDKITFKGVGNTSNAVVDTVTGKIGVGIDSPDANLHVLGNSYVSTNLELGGTLIMGTVNVSAHHSLEAVTAEGNTTPLTVEFSNATTGIVTTGNVEVGNELTVTGNATVSSNLIVSGNATVSSNLTVSGNTETKNINMLHTANTASIKLNSNVVTEFPRSKKLIKYPRVALTSDASTNSGYQGYKVSSSYFYPGYHYDWEAFDNGGDSVGWHTADTTPALRAYSGSGGTYAGTLQTRLASNTELGEWLQIELPDAIRLDRYVITPQGSPGSWTNCPTSAVVYGSNDGTTWKEVHRYTDAISDGDASKNFPFDANSTETYNHFALVVTKRNGGANGISVQEWELYGVPEYDPEAYGTDVMVKSVPNVPNTDWLDIYYDGQDYTSMPTTVDNKTGVSTYDATPINGVGFDATQKAFTFDANSSQYLSSSTPISGNYVHTISMWFKGTNLTPTGGDTLLWVGDNTNNKRIEIYIENDRINYNFRSNDCQAHTTFLNNRWYHLTCTYNGQQGSAGREIYVDGQRLSTFHTGNSADLNITNSTLNVGGFSGTSTTYMFSGFIANFRLFNRALTSDEVWQLYSYQKEYFGHGDLSMTLKAGRLGIGTSEPRAALDVRGVIRGHGLSIQTVSSTKTDTSFFSGTSITDIGGLSITIQPKFANSKIYVGYHILYGGQGRNFFRLKRTQCSSTSYFRSDLGPLDHASTSRSTTTDAFDNNDGSTRSASFFTLDDANGLEPITYTVQGWTYHSVYYVCVNRAYNEGASGNESYYGRGISSISAQEVCQ